MLVLKWEDVYNKNIADKPVFSGSALTVGSFDGVHFGHRKLFEKVINCDAELKKGVVTFLYPPKYSHKKIERAQNILTLRLKLKRFAEIGFDFSLLIDFSDSFAKIEGSDFIKILVKTVGMKYLVVGEDFACGHRRETGVAELKQLAQQLDFSFDSIKRIAKDGLELSSTAIRKAVYNADFTLTENLLGSPFLLDFKDSHWRKKNSGFEAPIAEFTQILPRCGKYNVRVLLDNGEYIDGQLQIDEKNATLIVTQENQSIEKFDSIIFIN